MSISESWLASNHSHPLLITKTETPLLNATESAQLIEYFKQNNSEISRGTNVNSAYNGRILSIETITDKEIQVLLIRVTTHMRTKIEEQFKPEKKIYPDAIHIVKWSRGQELDWHADNAYYPSREPNYTAWRLYSGVLFLNDSIHFTGGTLEFMDQKVNIQPKQGQGIVFEANLNYIHRVTPVTSGERFTVATWFTDDPQRNILRFTI